MGRLQLGILLAATAAAFQAPAAPRTTTGLRATRHGWLAGSMNYADVEPREAAWKEKWSAASAANVEQRAHTRGAAARGGCSRTSARWRAVRRRVWRPAAVFFGMDKPIQFCNSKPSFGNSKSSFCNSRGQVCASAMLWARGGFRWQHTIGSRGWAVGCNEYCNHCNPCEAKSAG